MDLLSQLTIQVQMGMNRMSPRLEASLLEEIRPRFPVLCASLCSNGDSGYMAVSISWRSMS